MNYQYKTLYGIGQKVWVRKLGSSGFITSIVIRSSETLYCIEYAPGDRPSFLESDLSDILVINKKKKKLS